MLTLLLSAAPAYAQATHLAVIVGLAGEPEHAELFTRWAGTLLDAAAKLGVEDVIYLAEKPEADAKRVTGRSTKDEIVKAFDKLATAGEDDVVFIVLIGHGTFDGKVAKFNLPGPDLTPADFEPLLKKVRSRNVVFVNTASASGPFIEALAGSGRTIVTATRTGAERFATLFGGYFVDALAGTDADADKNRRISVLEAFTYAKREVATAYEREGIMSTEHALLSDSGAKAFRIRRPTASRARWRRSCRSAASRRPTRCRPIRSFGRSIWNGADLERRIEALKLLKGSMPADRYTSELEKLATDLALKTRQIRELEKK